jgi:hypothetical protein
MGPGAQVGLSPSTNAEAHRTAGVPPFHLVHDGRRSISARISDRRHQRILRLPGVQACMLDHHRDIGLENAGITLSQGYWLWISEIVETEMLGAPCRDCHLIGASRLPVRIVESQHEVCFMVRRVKDAERLVACELRLRTIAPGGDITFGDRPGFSTDAF